MPSRRELVRMTDDEVTAFLAERHVMNLATVGPGGRLHLVAMWYGFLGANPAVVTFAKSQKVANVRRDPRMTGLVEDGEAYDQLRGVELAGAATVHEDPAVVLDVAVQVVRRYQPDIAESDVRAVAEVMSAKRVCLELVADHRTSWDHRKLAGRY